MGPPIWALALFLLVCVALEVWALVEHMVDLDSIYIYKYIYTHLEASGLSNYL